MTVAGEADLLDRLREIEGAELRLRSSAAAFGAEDLRAPSLCAGWTRGHVLAHVALNAHSLVNLMEWARTGVEIPQYPGWAERDADIERFSTRSKEEHLAALEKGAASFRSAARAVPLDRWSYEVRGIGGEPQPVERFLFGRLREVEIHHVDLDASYAAEDWDESFVRRMLDDVPARLGRGVEAAFTVDATDLGVRLQLGEGRPVVHVEGAGSALLAWLLGRSDGSALGGGPLPRVPAWG